MRAVHVGIAAGTVSVLLTLLAACGKKEAMASAGGSAIARADAPSQSLLISHLGAAAGGSAIAAATIAKTIGLTAVSHRSGAYIFTGTGGYVAGTIGGASALPSTVLVGAVVAGRAVTVELVCSIAQG